MLSARLRSRASLRSDASTRASSEDRVGLKKQPLHPIFPHQVLFIDSEIAEEETEGETGITT